MKKGFIPLRDMLKVNGLGNKKSLLFLNNKKGGAVIFMVIIISLLLSSIMMVMLDITQAMRISRNLDIALDAATKAASSQIDMDRLANYGDVRIDETLAPSVFKDIFELNFLQREQTGYALTETLEFTSLSTGSRITVFVDVFNDPQPVGFSLGDAQHNIQVPPTGNPVVAAFAVVRYEGIGLLGASYIRRVAVSQLTGN